MSDPHALATGGAAFEALRAHATANRLVMAQPPRQVMIADWRAVAADEPACDLAIPVRAA